MNPIKEQISSYISAVQESDGRFTASISYPSEFIGFQGHFPDNPVLPGVCMIQTVLMIASRNRDITLRQIDQAKFFSTVTCDEACRFEIAESHNDDGELMLKANIARGDEKIAKINLLITEA